MVSLQWVETLELTGSSSWPTRMTKDNIIHNNSNTIPSLQALSIMKIYPAVPYTAWPVFGIQCLFSSLYILDNPDKGCQTLAKLLLLPAFMQNAFFILFPDKQGY